MALLPLRLNRWSGCRRAACNASGLMVSAARAAVAKEGGGGGGDCGGRANGGAGGGGPWSVSASFSSSLPKTCAADSFISAQPNLAGCWRARLPRCAPAGTEPPVASAIAASVTCGSSKRDGLAAGCSVAGCCVTGCSVAGCCVAGCSVAGCSVVMNGQCGGCVQGRCESGWAASRTCTVTQLEVRCQGWWTLKLQRWHIWDACRHSCVMAARLHVCPLGTLELEGVTTAARADLDNHLLGPGWHTILLLHLTPRDGCRACRHGEPNFRARGETAAKSVPPRSGGLWYSR